MFGKIAPDAAESSRAWRWAAPVCYLSLAILMSWPYVAEPHTVSFLGYDSAIFLWNFWWTKFSLFDLGQSPFYCDYLYWPAGVNLALHSFSLPYNLISLPFQAAWGELEGAIIAAKFVVVMSLTLSAWFMFLLARRLVGSQSAAFCAGVIFAFFPFRMLHLHLLHVFCVEFIALWALLFLRLWERQTRGRTAALGAASALLLYASPEYALQAAIFAILFLAFALGQRDWRERMLRALLPRLACAVLIAAVLSLPLLVPIATGAAGAPPESFRAETVEKSPALAAFFAPNVIHPLWGRALLPAVTSLGAPDDGMRLDAPIGWAALALAAIGLLRGPRRAVWFWALGAIVFLVLTLGPQLRLTGNAHTGIPLPYDWLYRLLPPWRMMRFPLRFLPAAMLCLAALAAYGLAWLQSRRKNSWLPFACCALILLEYMTLPQPTGEIPIPGFYHRLARESGDFAILDVGSQEKLRLYYQIVHHKRMVGMDLTPVPRAGPQALGFVSDNISARMLLEEPDRFLRLSPDARKKAVAANRALFDKIGLRYIIVHRLERMPFGNYFDGVRIEEFRMGDEVFDAYDAVLRLHAPREIVVAGELTAYRF